MIEIRRIYNEYVGSDGYAVPLRIPRKVVADRPPIPPGWKSRNRRFERRLADYPPPTPQPTPCRLWQGGCDHYGYGSMKQYLPGGARRTVKVHRWVMEEALGVILRPDQVILHLCDNPPCFRVDHLRVGTIAENNADMMAKGRAVKPPINRLFGNTNPNTKVSPVQRVEVFEKWLTGTSMHKLAAEYSVSSQRIHAICKIFLSDDRAVQATIANLSAEGWNPATLCKRAGYDDRHTKWQLFQPVDLRLEALNQGGPGPTDLSAPDRTTAVKSEANHDHLDVP